MTASQINGVKVIGTAPIPTPLSGRTKGGPDKPVYYSKVVRLVLEGGDRSWIGCTQDGCDYAEQEIAGNPAPYRRIMTLHYRKVHGAVRAPHRNRAETKAGTKPGMNVDVTDKVEDDDIVVARLAQTVLRLQELVKALEARNTALRNDNLAKGQAIRQLGLSLGNQD